MAIRVCPMTYSDCTLSCGLSPKCLREIYAEASKGEAKPASPVRTRKQIMPGTYGPGARLNIEARDGEQSETYIDLVDGWYKAAEIREFARLLNEIADAMEDGK